MKKLFISILAFVTILCLLYACTPETGVVNTSTETVISVSAEILDKVENKTLKGYMDELVKKEFLTYTAENGMIISVNGRIADSAKQEYWMIYTSDASYGNSAWGSYTYQDKVFPSATLGIEMLPVKDGVIIVLAISTF